MSLLGHVYLLPDAKVVDLLAEPASVYAVVDGSYNQPGVGFVDLDKAWQCLHYLLTGTARDGEGPLSFLLKGGQAVGEEDLGGLGPARVFRPLEVARPEEARKARGLPGTLVRGEPALRPRFGLLLRPVQGAEARDRARQERAPRHDRLDSVSY
jgi:hypothetical protein